MPILSAFVSFQIISLDVAPKLKRYSPLRVAGGSSLNLSGGPFLNVGSVLLALSKVSPIAFSLAVSLFAGSFLADYVTGSGVFAVFRDNSGGLTALGFCGIAAFTA